MNSTKLINVIVLLVSLPLLITADPPTLKELENEALMFLISQRFDNDMGPLHDYLNAFDPPVKISDNEKELLDAFGKFLYQVDHPQIAGCSIEDLQNLNATVTAYGEMTYGSKIVEGLAQNLWTKNIYPGNIGKTIEDDYINICFYQFRGDVFSNLEDAFVTEIMSNMNKILVSHYGNADDFKEKLRSDLKSRELEIRVLDPTLEESKELRDWINNHGLNEFNENVCGSLESRQGLDEISEAIEKIMHYELPRLRYSAVKYFHREYNYSSANVRNAYEAPARRSLLNFYALKTVCNITKDLKGSTVIVRPKPPTKRRLGNMLGLF